MVNYKYPPQDSIIGANSDGIGGMVVSPPPQYIIIPADYDGDATFVIGDDSIPGFIQIMPDYIDLGNDTYPYGTWAILLSENDDKLNVKIIDNKIIIPEGTGNLAQYTIIVGEDRLQKPSTVVPNRLTIPPGYYPSEVIVDGITKMLLTDQKKSIFISNPLIKVGDEYFFDAWPTVITGMDRLAIQTYGEYLLFGLEERWLMSRGDTANEFTLPTRFSINSAEQYLSLGLQERWLMELGDIPVRLQVLSANEYLSYSLEDRWTMIRGGDIYEAIPPTRLNVQSYSEYLNYSLEDRWTITLGERTFSRLGVQSYGEYLSYGLEDREVMPLGIRGVRLQVLSHAEYLSYGLEARSTMERD